MIQYEKKVYPTSTQLRNNRDTPQKPKGEKGMTKTYIVIKASENRRGHPGDDRTLKIPTTRSPNGDCHEQVKPKMRTLLFSFQTGERQLPGRNKFSSTPTTLILLRGVRPLKAPSLIWKVAVASASGRGSSVFRCFSCSRSFRDFPAKRPQHPLVRSSPPVVPSPDPLIGLASLRFLVYRFQDISSNSKDRVLRSPNHQPLALYGQRPESVATFPTFHLH
jgi:hypothetical protein